ncbi:putative peptide transporter ptr2 [Neolecta irregularis DAH-3]|uniref:Putative peptide transporter ptr2 n=1 Tax=Neolecta irregularis (strain DAH-3) TaxID=1198029 RepID=A0A1U7LIX3_NEOID|nr:putative peptide transporter ptr2 [Neolecta irregularis DAH-3]|eukprot:OLL22605.1 putative peptide transporter ptr2 [Neolecta irregularis DAH-3]
MANCGCRTLREACDHANSSLTSNRFTYYGLVGVLQNYVQYKPDSKIPGGLGRGQQSATALGNFFTFWCYVTPIIGAVIADQYLGKYKTICLFCAVYFVGELILLGTSVPASIRDGHAFGGYITAIIIIGIGTGGIKSNVSPLVAEQAPSIARFVRTEKSGKKVIVDPALTTQRIFMYFYFGINVGSLSALATTNLRSRVGYWAAFILPTCVFTLAIAILLLGRKLYIVRPPEDSVILKAFQALWVAACNGFNMDAAKPSYLTAKKSYLKVKWNDQFIDEIKRTLVACRIFLFFPIYWICYSQISNNLISQAGEMRLGNTPNDLLQNLNPITLIVFIPLVERFLYPGLRKIGIRFLPITRISWGFFLAAIAMAYAAIVEHRIYNTGPCFSHITEKCSSNNIGVWSGAYILIGLSEIFASISGLEYAFTKAGPSMKSFVMSLFLLTTAGGAIFSIALSSVAVPPKIMWMYSTVSIICFTTGIIFWFTFRHLNDKEDEMNALEALGTKPLAIVEKAQNQHENAV